MFPGYIETPKFYSRHAIDVAQDLLGKKLVFGNQSGIITETEAYRGADFVVCLLATSITMAQENSVVH